MLRTIEALGDRLLGLVVPRLTAGADPGCECSGQAGQTIEYPCGCDCFWHVGIPLHQTCTCDGCHWSCGGCHHIWNKACWCG